MLNRLLENFKVKLFSFFAAFFFWLVVISGNNHTDYLYVPVKAKNVPENKVIVSPLPKRVKVKVEGKGKALLALRFFKQAALEVDLANVYSNDTLPLSPRMLELTPRLPDIYSWQVLSLDSIYILMAQKVARKVPVVPDIQVQPLPGYAVVGGIRLSPDSVTIEGPINHVEAVQKVLTEKRMFKEVKYRFSGRVRIKPFPDSLQITITPKDVHYSVDIQKLLELTFEEIPIKVVNAPRGWRVGAVPSTLKLTLAGGERLLMQLRKKDIQAIIDYHQDKIPGKEGYRVQIKLPPEIRIVQMHPERFKLVKERQRVR